jgi:type IV secretion system protein VirD4
MIDFKKSMHYNPFAYIHSEKDILKFVTALIANTKGEDTKGGEDFWIKAETLLYCALVGLIHYESKTPEERNMNTLVELINIMEVREEDESFQNAVDIVFERLEKGKPLLGEDGNQVVAENGEKLYIKPPQPNHFAVRQYKKFKLAAGLICSKGRFNQRHILEAVTPVAAQRTDGNSKSGTQPGKGLHYGQKDSYLLPFRACQ